MQLEDLCEHLRIGGAALLEHPAIYSVSPGSVIAPARYAGRGRGAEFVFETRFVDGEFRRTALIDSKQSQANRAEEGLLAARRRGGPATRIPLIEVRYEGREPLFDLNLPHRAFDAHVRFASQDGEPVVAREWYRNLRDCTHADLSPLFVTSPVTVAFGGWDSTRKSGQVRLRGLYVSELFGAVAGGNEALSRRSGARLDPLGQDFNVSPDGLWRLLDRQREHLSPKKVKEIENTVERARKKAKDGEDAPMLSAAVLNLGGIPPSTEAPFGVSVPEVRRVRTFSLAGLRRLRFGGNEQEDVAARGALLAILLLGAAYADADPELRAYCDVSAPRAEVKLDGAPVELDLSLDACERFLAWAIAQLPDRLAWQGQRQVLEGDPLIARGAVEEGTEEGE